MFLLNRITIAMLFPLALSYCGHSQAESTSKDTVRNGYSSDILKLAEDVHSQIRQISRSDRSFKDRLVTDLTMTPRSLADSKLPDIDGSNFTGNYMIAGQRFTALKEPILAALAESRSAERTYLTFGQRLADAGINVSSISVEEVASAINSAVYTLRGFPTAMFSSERRLDLMKLSVFIDSANRSVGETASSPLGLLVDPAQITPIIFGLNATIAYADDIVNGGGRVKRVGNAVINSLKGFAQACRKAMQELTTVGEPSDRPEAIIDNFDRQWFGAGASFSDCPSNAPTQQSNPHAMIVPSVEDEKVESALIGI